MPTRRKTIAGCAGFIGLLGGLILAGDENGSDHDPDDSDVEDPESDPEPTLEPEPEDETARFSTTVTVPGGVHRVGETVEFDVVIENVGTVTDTYTVTLDLDRVDPDTDFGSNTWDLTGQLEPDAIESHLADHTYQATGTYELRLDDEVITELDVLGIGGSSSASTVSQSNTGRFENDQSDDAITVGVGGTGVVNAREEHASEYDLE